MTTRQLYSIIANAALLLTCADFGAQVALNTYDRFAPRLHFRRLSAAARTSYAHMTRPQIDDLLRTTAGLRVRYTHASGFAIEAVTSRLVNVDSRGIRSNGGDVARKAAMNDADWFFGGSTVFGWAISDSETIPARLEQILGTPVLNLGVPSHASVAENRLLNHHLRNGARPRRAIFLDGINESCIPDSFDDDLAVLVSRAQDGYRWEPSHSIVDAYALARRVLMLRLGFRSPPTDPLQLTCRDAGREFPLRALHARAMAERNALCALYAIECRTFVQPFAGVHGRHDDDEFRNGPDAAYLRGLFAHLAPSWRATGATFVTGALDRGLRHAFVDTAHYSAAASQLIAEDIARELR